MTSIRDRSLQPFEKRLAIADLKTNKTNIALSSSLLSNTSFTRFARLAVRQLREHTKDHTMEPSLNQNLK